MASKNRLDQAAGASIGGFFSKADESKPEPTARESRKPPYTDEQMDEALKTVYRTGKQQDGADYLQEPIKSTPAEEKAEEKPNTKQKKQVFSFRATLDNIADWKAYATATGQTMENVGTAAMNEYLDRHKLTGAEQAIFEAMKAKSEK